MIVAPVRERGLKSIRPLPSSKGWSRSREGAWIEIPARKRVQRQSAGRSREGAWIEIFSDVTCDATSTVAPVRERGLK